MTAPSDGGNYREDWKLISRSGVTIPVSGSNTIWVDIKVEGSLAGPFISRIDPPTVVFNQMKTLTVHGSGFQPNFTAEIVTPASPNPFPILSGGRIFDNAGQVRVQVEMGGTESYAATLRIKNPDHKVATGNFQVVKPTQPQAVSPFEVTAIEVTQGIQDLLNSVTLIQDRATYVRVHVRSNEVMWPMSVDS